METNVIILIAVLINSFLVRELLSTDDDLKRRIDCFPGKIYSINKFLFSGNKNPLSFPF